MLPYDPWSSHSYRDERSLWYKANDIFFEFIIDPRYPEAIYRTRECGYLHDDLSEYNIGCMSARNEFTTAKLWDANPLFYHCDLKTFQMVMAGRPMTDAVLRTIRPKIIRKLYSSLSNEQKIIAKQTYDWWTFRGMGMAITRNIGSIVADYIRYLNNK